MLCVLLPRRSKHSRRQEHASAPRQPPHPASFPLLSSRLQFQPSEALDVPSFPFASRWILSKLNGAVGTTIRGMEAYEFSIATSVSGLCTTVLLLIGGGIQLWGPCALVCLA